MQASKLGSADIGEDEECSAAYLIVRTVPLLHTSQVGAPASFVRVSVLRRVLGTVNGLGMGHGRRAQYAAYWLW